MSSHHHCVCKELLKLLNTGNALVLIFWIDVRLEIRVSCALIYSVPDLLTATTPDVLQLFELVLELVVSIRVILIVFFAFMFGEFASRVFFVSFAAAPPHFSSPFALMGAAAPVVIFFFVVFFAAFLAYFLVLVYSEATVLQLQEPLFHFFPLIHELFVLFVQTPEFLDPLVKICLLLLQILF